MVFPYAALIGLAANASSNIGDKIYDEVSNKRKKDLDRQKDLIEVAYRDAVANALHAPTHFADLVSQNNAQAAADAAQRKKGILSDPNTAGLALQALGALGGGGDQRHNYRPPSDFEISKYSQLTEPRLLSDSDPTAKYSLTGDFKGYHYGILDDDDKLTDPWGYK